ncbi:CCA tRNA nucleotidyltransferase [Rhizobium sp. MHM7A]|uniref:CCA tRNA nucleotidyltransferase n=1 Tax=Rhizobium sp. MHM7A TaxID=2583233 RepID=UPI00110736D1|nr:CCA tRNA nucleotidyltransferase [Rhizobium sp. MHM7A]TLX17101.1 CCA tRNA nucleotidyltransferase [Rhizobium sp. MHM7A]
MQIELDDPRVHAIMDRLTEAGAQVRFVGGAVRDLVAGLPFKDVDLTTDFLPEDVIDLFEDAGFDVIPTGLKHGTVTVVVDGEPFEVTTLRADLSTDGRHAEVGFVTDFKVDAERRDFTINAMSADRAGKVYDYFGGIDDLNNGRVRFVGDPEQRVQEDYLRILRYFRFRGRFGVTDHAQSLQAIKQHAGGLERISVERVWREVSQILSLQRSPSQLVSMETLGVSQVIGLPFTSSFTDQFVRLREETSNSAILLGAIVSDADEAEKLGYRWRLSSKERRQAMTAARVIQDGSPDSHYWRVKQYDGFDVATLKAVLNATGRTEAANGLFASVPDFPLRGRDLLAIGIPAGASLGTALSDLENTWKNSQFTLDANELLEIAKLQYTNPERTHGL